MLSSEWMQPFSSAVSVVGNITLFLSLLILSSRYYDYKGCRIYLQANAIMLGFLLLALLLGNVYGLAGMANVSTTFFILWLMEKYTEWHLESRHNGWLLLLAASVSVYYCALWLHMHPHFIADMFTA